MSDQLIKEKKGIILRILGVMTILLWGMNSALSWRGGLGENTFNTVFLILGLIFYALGLVRGRYTG